MRELTKIKAEYLYKAIYEACYKANINLSEENYYALKNLQENKLEPASKMVKIFDNCVIANKNKRPLCQDTGQVIIFLEIGEEIILDNKNPTTIANKAVSDCYKDNFFRKSIVENAFFNRQNTQNNIPAIVYINYVSGKTIKADVLIKGGGAENMSAVKMLPPTAEEKDIFNYVLSVVDNAGENACPPIFLGIGIGGTLDYASVLSKKAFFSKENIDFAKKLQNYINQNSNTKIANINILTSSTHIASMPICVTINCHCSRHASVLINKDGYKLLTKFFTEMDKDTNNTTLETKEISTNDIKSLKNTNINEEILLTGTIYVARDMAHKKLCEMIKNKEKLPFNLKNSIIFYAGPCPQKENEIIGPIGPTTAKRMDKFAPLLYEKGVLATIGKGPRSKEVLNSIQKNNALYFSAQGGVASLLQNCIKSAQIIAFEDLGTEAIYKLEIEKLPVKLELK